MLFCAACFLNCNELEKSKLNISEKIVHGGVLFTGKFRDGDKDSSYRIVTCTNGIIDKIEYYTFSNCDEIETVKPLFQDFEEGVSVYEYFLGSDSIHEKILVVLTKQHILSNLKDFLFQNVVYKLNRKKDSSIVIWTYDKIYLDSDPDKSLNVYELNLRDSTWVRKL